MSQNGQQPAQPLAPTATFTRSDEEARSSHQAKALRRNNRMRCLLYVLIFAIFQVGVITLFALTIAKFRNPKFRVRSATFETFNVVPVSNGSTGGPSFNIRMNTELGVKNTNFGHFRYRNSTVEFYYGDSNYKVGEAFIDRARAKARSTRKFNVTVDLSSRNVTGNSNLGTDIGRGILPLRSLSRLRGSVKIMVILKKNRNANMDCTMDLVIASQQLQNIICR